MIEIEINMNLTKIKENKNTLISPNFHDLFFLEKN